VTNSGTSGRRAVRAYRTELFLFLLATVLYIPGIAWDLPYASGPDRVYLWATDDIAPLGPLTETHNTFVPGAVNRWLTYPLAHHFILTIVYSPYLIWLGLTGGLARPTSVYPFGFSDPVTTFKVLTLIARAVSIGMAAGTVTAAYRIGCILWDRHTGLVAFVIALLPFPMAYYAHTANLELPALFWTSLALTRYARILVDGLTAPRAAGLAAFAALAVATKDQAAGVFLLLPLALLPLHVQRRGATSPARWSVPAAFFGSGATVYALFSGLVLDPHRYLAHVNFSLHQNAVIRASYLEWFPLTPGGVIGLSAELFRLMYVIFGPLLMLAGLASILHASLRERTRLVFALPAVSHVLTLIVIVHFAQIRYAMPVMFVLSIFAARGVGLGLGHLPSFAGVRMVAMLAICAWPLWASVDLVFQMVNDSRHGAGTWLATQMGPGTTLAHCGDIQSLPRVRSDIQILEVSGTTAWRQSMEEHRPDVVILLPDWTSKPGMEHSRRCPEEFIRDVENGRLGYELAAGFKTRSSIQRQLLDYPSVNPAVQIFVKEKALEKTRAIGARAGDDPTR
jgi:hypothetical protein